MVVFSLTVFHRTVHQVLSDIYFPNMFDPASVKFQAEKRELLNDLSRKCYLLVPEDPKELRQQLMVFCKEVQCGGNTSLLMSCSHTS